MTMTVETPPPDHIRPAAVAGVLLGDLIAPAAIYYAARALGAPVVLALILGGLACLPRQVAGLARRGRLDGLGTAVLVAFALSGLLSLLSGDARVLIVKDAVWPLAAGVVAAGSCVRGKPVTFFMLRPMLSQGRPRTAPSGTRSGPTGARSGAACGSWRSAGLSSCSPPARWNCCWRYPCR